MKIVFLLFYQFRAESTGCDEHLIVWTPNLDQLAMQGTRFDQCHIQASLYSLSRCSLMTDWYPHVKGHRRLWSMVEDTIIGWSGSGIGNLSTFLSHMCEEACHYE